MPTVEERFWAKVDRRGLLECWLWTAFVQPNGYGQFGHQLAHRVAYELAVGPIPAGLQIDHLCRNRACINPAHLEPVTLAQNVLRGVGHTAINARKTACVHGHPYDDANTYHDPKRGWRQCRTCREGRPLRQISREQANRYNANRRRKTTLAGVAK